MEEKRIDLARHPVNVDKILLQHNISKPAWQREKTCEQCRFCDQDVDTFPCDRCHTRH